MAAKRCIYTRKPIQEQASKAVGREVPKSTVTKIMKGESRLSFKKLPKVPLLGNTQRCKVLRSLYAQKMLPVYADGHHVINIDETWLPSTNYYYRAWSLKGEASSCVD